MFLYSSWLKLPLTTRNAIALNFGIEKKGPTEVFENRIVKDGFLLDDIETKLTVQSIQAFLASGVMDMETIWEALIARIEGREPVKVEPVIETPVFAAVAAEPVPPLKVDTTEKPIAVVAKKKAGRPKKK